MSNAVDGAELSRRLTERSSVRLEQAVSAQELTRVRLCKQPGCTDEVARPGLRGIMGAYCDYHAGLVNKNAAEKRAGPRAVGGFEDRAKELVRLGRDLDKAKANADETVRVYREAKQAWQDALAKLTNPGGLGADR